MHEPVSMGEIWREWAALIEEWLTGQGEPMSHIFLGKVLGKDLGRFWTGFGQGEPMQHILGKVLDKVVGTNAMQCNGNSLFYTLGQCDIWTRF